MIVQKFITTEKKLPAWKKGLFLSNPRAAKPTIHVISSQTSFKR